MYERQKTSIGDFISETSSFVNKTGGYETWNHVWLDKENEGNIRYNEENGEKWLYRNHFSSFYVRSSQNFLFF